MIKINNYKPSPRLNRINSGKRIKVGAAPKGELSIRDGIFILLTNLTKYDSPIINQAKAIEMLTNVLNGSMVLFNKELEVYGLKVNNFREFQLTAEQCAKLAVKFQVQEHPLYLFYLYGVEAELTHFKIIEKGRVFKTKHIQRVGLQQQTEKYIEILNKMRQLKQTEHYKQNKNHLKEAVDMFIAATERQMDRIHE